MGTRADFYVGRGKDAEWIGSIAWDGYPSGIPEEIIASGSETLYRDRVASMIAERDDGTTPQDGWPWPWEDSRTTDYAYAFDGGEVHASCFGHGWFPARKHESIEDHYTTEEKSAEFPDMSGVGEIATIGSKRSGIMVLGVK